MYPYPVSNSVPGQQGKYRGAKGEQSLQAGWWGCPIHCLQMELELGTLSHTPGSLPPQRSDQHQPASAPPMMQAAAAAGPPLVAATPYSSYIPYTPQQFPGQPAMMQPMAHYPSQVTEAQGGCGGGVGNRAKDHICPSPRLSWLREASSVLRVRLGLQSSLW